MAMPKDCQQTTYQWVHPCNEILCPQLLAKRKSRK